MPTVAYVPSTRAPPLTILPTDYLQTTYSPTRGMDTAHKPRYRLQYGLDSRLPKYLGLTFDPLYSAAYTTDSRLAIGRTLPAVLYRLQSQPHLHVRMVDLSCYSTYYLPTTQSQLHSTINLTPRPRLQTYPPPRHGFDDLGLSLPPGPTARRGRMTTGGRNEQGVEKTLHL